MGWVCKIYINFKSPQKQDCYNIIDYAVVIVDNFCLAFTKLYFTSI